ncbi:MAG TPA: hypothetical protein VJ965_03865, partial [Anaerolineales bacterium]|nr:hypothetical protein [Anaerolineales bacterium]
MSDKGLLRKDAPAESKWAGHEVFPTWDDWQKEYDEVEELIPEAGKFVGKLMDSPENLAEWMAITNDLNLRTGRLM